MAKIHVLSRLRFYKLMSVKGIEFWDIGKIEVEGGGEVIEKEFSSTRLDKIAADELRSPILWYEIAEVNGIRLPRDLYSGVLKIPVRRS
jgi:hypothetical protein